MNFFKASFLLFTICALSISTQAQKYFTKTGLTDFKASVDTFEPVEASNKSTTAILNTETGDVAALMFINAFEFRVALMQEHFNENYMDSAEHPKASFKGTLADFDFAALSEENTEYRLTGSITIKGIEKELDTAVILRKVGDKILAEATFDLLPSDFGIDIPSIVREKISETIHVSFNYELQEKK